jgi:arabinoxylan arabinofuranohydrolase
VRALSTRTTWTVVQASPIHWFSAAKPTPSYVNRCCNVQLGRLYCAAQPIPGVGESESRQLTASAQRSIIAVQEYTKTGKGLRYVRGQRTNPYLPSWEYIPDGEPYVFGDRVYVYGSHDRFNGYVYCLNDYVCWSAPIHDLSDWRYEGVIYRKTDDPLNLDGRMCLYAPDVTVGPDGRYYLFYVLDKVSVVSVAVSDTPAGKYEFYGYVRHADGTRLGERPGDQPQFDPGVLTEGENTYLYTGFCPIGDRSRKGAMATVLGPDMLSIVEEPVIISPSEPYSAGSGFEGHEFFEAPSIRKRGDTYYFIYSSIARHELCYATSKHPTKGFEYRGVIVSNCDLHIDSYKPADKPMYPSGNNHGSIVEVNGDWYIFYHRHTNGTEFSRQGCLEKIRFEDDGTIPQVEMTSCGSIENPLIGKGEYPTYLACNLFCMEEPKCDHPKITQDGRDGDEEPGYIANMRNSTTAGFKYFDCRGITKVKVKVRGYCRGQIQVKTSWDGEPLGAIPVDFSNIWTEYAADIAIPDGIQALYFTFVGGGSGHFGSFALE